MVELTLEQLFEIVELCCKETDGHFTLMKFTTEWKAMFSTPDLDTGKGRKEIKNIPGFATMEDAILDAIHRHAQQQDKEGKQ